MGEQIQSQKLRKVPEVGAMENPPGSESKREGPAWELPETKGFMKKFQGEAARFNTCTYQTRSKTKWFKPGQFGGRLSNLSSMRRMCKCPRNTVRESQVGRKKTGAAARYPEELCDAYAKLVVDSFKTTLKLEWWRHAAQRSENTFNQAQAQWVKSKEKQQAKPLEDIDMQEVRNLKRVWTAEDSGKDALLEAGPPKKQRREEENEFFIGGRRNPAKSVEKLGVMRNAAKDVVRLWSTFVRDRPEATKAARDYGREGCELKEEHVKEWRQNLLGEVVESEGEPGVEAARQVQVCLPAQCRALESMATSLKGPREDDSCVG